MKIYKAYLVVKGFTQKEGIDFSETLSSVSSKGSFRIIMTLVIYFDLELQLMNVKTTILNSDIDETIYMSQLENFGLIDAKNMVCNLKKLIYRLKQATYQWYYKFHQIIILFDFEINKVDNCVYNISLVRVSIFYWFYISITYRLLVKV